MAHRIGSQRHLPVFGSAPNNTQRILENARNKGLAGTTESTVRPGINEQKGPFGSQMVELTTLDHEDVRGMLSASVQYDQSTNTVIRTGDFDYDAAWYQFGRSNPEEKEVAGLLAASFAEQELDLNLTQDGEVGSRVYSNRYGDKVKERFVTESDRDSGWKLQLIDTNTGDAVAEYGSGSDLEDHRITFATVEDPDGSSQHGRDDHGDGHSHGHSHMASHKRHTHPHNHGLDDFGWDPRGGWVINHNTDQHSDGCFPDKHEHLDGLDGLNPRIVKFEKPDSDGGFFQTYDNGHGRGVHASNQKTFYASDLDVLGKGRIEASGELDVYKAPGKFTFNRNVTAENPDTGSRFNHHVNREETPDSLKHHEGFSIRFYNS